MLYIYIYDMVHPYTMHKASKNNALALYTTYLKQTNAPCHTKFFNADEAKIVLKLKGDVEDIKSKIESDTKFTEIKTKLEDMHQNTLGIHSVLLLQQAQYQHTVFKYLLYAAKKAANPTFEGVVDRIITKPTESDLLFLIQCILQSDSTMTPVQADQERALSRRGALLRYMLNHVIPYMQVHENALYMETEYTNIIAKWIQDHAPLLTFPIKSL